MKYKISISTYNLDIIEAFSALKNRKSQFVEQALINFIFTQKGKDTLCLMIKQPERVSNDVGKEKGTCSIGKKAAEGSGKISVDSFLK